DYVGEGILEYSYKISLLNNHYQESALSEPVKASTRMMSDEELLDMVQEANFRYYWEGAESNSGLALENIPGRRKMVASGSSGFGIMALLVGVERAFITRKEAIERFMTITSFLENADTFHGAFSHFIDGPTGKAEPFFGPKDNGGDLVETSFLLQGLLAAQQYFDRDNTEENLIRERIQKIWENVEWNWYRKEPESDFLTWHWSPDQGWVIDHQLIGWNETMITYLLAIASPTHPIPASMYYSGWASQSSVAQNYRSAWGKTEDGKNYTNGNTYFGIPLEVGVCTGGPLFFIHYSYLGADPSLIDDAYTNYFENNQNIAKISYRYSIENPKGFQGYGKDNWGLTASDGPHRYSPNEAAAHADEGKMTPTGALASIPYTPEESMAALKNYYFNYGHFLWGEYGFRDAFNLDLNWCSELYMGLNQAPIVVMIENYRTGLIWNLFMENEDFQKALTQIKNKK
ncbi:MAG TPA: glucoamylase family protein, partial [Anditalea sp.]|nr:glucoamylase family protein [Anditalea sp.]